MDRKAVLRAIARGWCAPLNSHKEMDSALANSICDEIMALREQAAQPVPSVREITEKLAGLHASSQCPLCGRSGFHKHSPEDIIIYRNGVKSALRTAEHWMQKAHELQDSAPPSESEAQPVAWVLAGSLYFDGPGFQKHYPTAIPLYTTPPAPTRETK